MIKLEISLEYGARVRTNNGNHDPQSEVNLSETSSLELCFLKLIIILLL